VERNTGNGKHPRKNPHVKFRGPEREKRDQRASVRRWSKRCSQKEKQAHWEGRCLGKRLVKVTARER